MNDHGYKGIPPLAGIASMDDAMKPGLSVEQCVARLKRYHYAFKRLHHILTARITAEPIYELKTAFSHHAYLCAEHVQALRTRVAEMREPPLGLDEVPHPALEAFFDEIRAAPTAEFVFGYGIAVYEMWAAIGRYEKDTHPLTDAPSRRALRFARIELGDMMSWVGQAVHALTDTAKMREVDEWSGYLSEVLKAAGSLDGT